MTLPKIAVLPTCNLSQNIQFSWLQCLREKNIDISDNLAKAIIQIYHYCHFLKNGEKGKGHDRLELLLSATRHQGSHASLAHGIDKHASKLHDRFLHLEGEEHFGFI